MKQFKLFFTALVCITIIGGCSTNDTISKPEKEDVLSSLRLANDYFMEKWSDPGEPIPYPSRNREYESTEEM